MSKRTDAAETVRKKLAELFERGVLGATQTAAAKRLRVDQSSFNLYLSGVRRPSMDVLVRLAGAIGMSTDELLGLPPRAPDPLTPVEVEAAGTKEKFDALAEVAGQVGAGPPILDVGDDPRQYAFRKDWVRRHHRGKLAMIKVAEGRLGESMRPTIEPGDALAVDLGPRGEGVVEWKKANNGRVYLVQLPGEDGLQVKRGYVDGPYLVLMSDNPLADQRIRTIPLTEHKLPEVLKGMVLWVSRELA